MGSKYPDIIIMVMDATRARNLSCYGYKRKTTPNIDLFAKKAILYENAISVSNWTLPSVTSIFTGLLPSEHGVIDETCKLKQSIPTLAELLKRAGYTTVCISNNGFVSKFFNLDRGFDIFIEIDNYILPKNKFSRVLDYLRRLIYVKDYGAKTTNNYIIKYLNHQYKGKKPIFMYVHYVEPHFPYNPRFPSNLKYHKFPWHLSIIREVYKNKIPKFYCGEWATDENKLKILVDLYDGEISYLDKKIGEVLKIIDDVLDLDNTLVIITADHGECFAENRTLRILGHETGLYDDLIRVPLIVKYPNDEGGRRVYFQVQTIDIFGTILKEILGKKNYISLIDKEENEDLSRFAFSESSMDKSTFKKLARCPTIYTERKISIRSNEYKLIWGKYKEFYNLKNDPLELRNIYSLKDISIRNTIKEFTEVLNKKYYHTQLKRRIKLVIGKMLKESKLF